MKQLVSQKVTKKNSRKVASPTKPSMLSTALSSTHKSAIKNKTTSKNPQSQIKKSPIPLSDRFRTFSVVNKWHNLSSMEQMKPYLITGAVRGTSCYGPRIEVNLNNQYYLSLPERYNGFTDQEIVELSSGRYYLINEGKLSNSKQYSLQLLSRDELQTAISSAVAVAADHIDTPSTSSNRIIEASDYNNMDNVINDDDNGNDELQNVLDTLEEIQVPYTEGNLLNSNVFTQNE